MKTTRSDDFYHISLSVRTGIKSIAEIDAFIKPPGHPRYGLRLHAKIGIERNHEKIFSLFQAHLTR
jgi:hypothetical protein